MRTQILDESSETGIADPGQASDTLTCRMVKFSSTLFIMYFSGRCFSLWMKLIMYSHSGERWMRKM